MVLFLPFSSERLLPPSFFLLLPFLLLLARGDSIMENAACLRIHARLSRVLDIPRPLYLFFTLLLLLDSAQMYIHQSP